MIFFTENQNFKFRIYFSIIKDNSDVKKSMDFHWFSLTFNDFLEFRWLFMTFCGFSWIMVKISPVCRYFVVTYGGAGTILCCQNTFLWLEEAWEPTGNLLWWLGAMLRHHDFRKRFTPKAWFWTTYILTLLFKRLVCAPFWVCNAERDLPRTFGEDCTQESAANRNFKTVS